LAGFGGRHAFQYIFKIFPGINLLFFAAGQQGVKECWTLSAFIGSGEQGVFPTQRHWTDRIFNRVVVDVESAIRCVQR
jgi:hypothetical protein